MYVCYTLFNKYSNTQIELTGHALSPRFRSRGVELLPEVEAPARRAAASSVVVAGSSAGTTQRLAVAGKSALQPCRAGRECSSSLEVGVVAAQVPRQHTRTLADLRGAKGAMPHKMPEVTSK